MASVTSISTLTLDLPPSCIAFCPSHSDIFVVGTYFLHAGEPAESTEAKRENNTVSEGRPQPLQKRSGSLILFQLTGDTTRPISTLLTESAILDLQWAPCTPDVLGVATSTGEVAFYRLQPDRSGLVLLGGHRVCSPSTLVLSLTWHPTASDVLAVTLSDGRVMLLFSTTSSALSGSDTSSSAAAWQVREIHTHAPLEAWTAAFGVRTQLSPTTAIEDTRLTILSGGDDAVLRASATSLAPAPTLAPRFVDRRSHAAGVTAILPLSETLVVTGSYDDRIRLLRLPESDAEGGVRRVLELASLDLEGGVWRLKALAVADDGWCVLASCMHTGARVVKLRPDAAESWGFEVIARFEEHESMNYGSDVQPGRGGASGDAKTIVSTSFYDRRLCLWRV